MVEAYRPSDIEKVPSEQVPFFLLKKREQEVLQLLSDGTRPDDIASGLVISTRTFETHRHNIALIGMGNRYYMENEYPRQPLVTILALIQDGVRHGYIDHQLPEQPIESLSPQEESVCSLTIIGSSIPQTAIALFNAPKTIEAHRANIHKKLHTNTVYQMAARVTFLQDRKMLKVQFHGKTRDAQII